MRLLSQYSTPNGKLLEKQQGRHLASVGRKFWVQRLKEYSSLGSSGNVSILPLGETAAGCRRAKEVGAGKKERVGPFTRPRRN